MKEVDILIVHLNGADVIKNCLQSIFDDDPSARVKLLFNATTDESPEFVRKKFPKVMSYHTKERWGFAQASNFLVKKSKNKYVIFLNNDVVVGKNWAIELLKTLKRNKNCVAVQSKIKSYYRRDYFEHAGAAGGFVDQYGYPFCRGRIFDVVEKDTKQYDNEIRIFWGCGVSLLVDRNYFIKAGMFDELFFMYAEELDFCWRANNAGKEIWFSPKSTIYHMGSFSVSNEKINFKKEYFISRNHYLALIKSGPFSHILGLLFGKTILELISLVRFPIKRGIPFLMSLPYIIYYLVSQHKNMHHPTIRKEVRKMIYPRSIALDHFLKHKCKYSNLKWD